MHTFPQKEHGQMVKESIRNVHNISRMNQHAFRAFSSAKNLARDASDGQNK